MSDPKSRLLDRIGQKCDQLEEILASYKRLHELGGKGATLEYLELVEAIGAVTLSNLSDAGNLMQALLRNG